MPAIANVRYTHEAIIDEIIADPSISQGELAARFGFSQSWMSIIINSDSFKQRLAERKAEFVDPKLKASVEDRLDAIARRSLDKLLDRLDGPHNLKTAELVSIAKLGVGDRNTKGPSAPNLYVLQIPPPAPDSKTWVASASGRTPRGDVVEAQILNQG